MEATPISTSSEMEAAKNEAPKSREDDDEEGGLDLDWSNRRGELRVILGVEAVERDGEATEDAVVEHAVNAD